MSQLFYHREKMYTVPTAAAEIQHLVRSSNYVPTTVLLALWFVIVFTVHIVATAVFEITIPDVAFWIISLGVMFGLYFLVPRDKFKSYRLKQRKIIVMGEALVFNIIDYVTTRYALVLEPETVAEYIFGHKKEQPVRDEDGKITGYVWLQNKSSAEGLQMVVMFRPDGQSRRKSREYVNTSHHEDDE